METETRNKGEPKLGGEMPPTRISNISINISFISMIKRE
jgi:hypothetical protein